jgi:hypothetical protein
VTVSATELDARHLRAHLADIDDPMMSGELLNDPRSGVVLHLAVMTGPFLELIRGGVKTVESRFHRSRCSPLHVARPGDVVVFRQSGHPATLAAVLGETLFLDLSEHSLNKIRRTWAQRIAAEDDAFWDARRDARWVSLLTLDRIFRIPPIALHKRDRRGWVTYLQHRDARTDSAMRSQ